MLQNDPFRLLEGMMIAGYAVGAQNGYLYVREEYRFLHPMLKSAIKQMEEKGYLGNNILGSNFNYNIHLYSGAGAYVCGEGSALIESIEGKSGRPRIKPPFIKQCGLNLLPTCVNNVETLAIATGLLAHGAEAYTKFGTEDCPGTKIVSVAGNVVNPGVYEVPFGITLKEIIYDIAGGIPGNKKVNLVQVGGASGKIGPASILDTPLTYDGMHKAGLIMGSGAILVIDESMSVLEYLKSIQEFFSHESCGKCTPCREGNKQIAHIIDRLIAGTQKDTDVATLKRFATIMSTSSFCGLGETAQNALLNAMRFFPEVFGLN
jgi:NADH-quinone oxidoreductase subunit F